MAGSVVQVLSNIFPLTSAQLQWNENVGPGNIEFLKKELRNTDDKLGVFYGDANIKSLLFQAAVNYSTDGSKVIMVCSSELEELPEAMHGMPRPSISNMANVEIVYVPSYKLLLKYLINLHLQSHMPSVLIIENIHDFVSGNENSVLHQRASVCSLLVDTLTLVSQRGTNSFSALLGDSSSQDLTALYHQFVEMVYIVKAGENTNEFELQSHHRITLQLNQPKLGSSENEVLIKYTSTRGQLLLSDLFVLRTKTVSD